MIFSSKTGAARDMAGYGRRAAEAMNVAHVLDRTLEALFATAADPTARDVLTQLRARVRTENETLIAKVAEIYATVYTADELEAVVEFLEGPAGRAMRAKQADVETKVQQATTEFLQGLLAANR